MRSSFTLLCLLFLIPFSLVSQVNGVALLANESIHNDIWVRFSPTSVSGALDSTLTDSLGQYSIALVPGVYVIDYSKAGFQPRSYDNGLPTFLSGSVSLDTVELQPGPFRLVNGNVSGVFDRDTAYVVTGDLLVPSGQSLSIESGTRILFNGPYKFDVNGSLNALGNPNEKILFSNNSSVFNDRWAGIQLSGGGNSVFEWCTFEEAETGIEVFGNASSPPLVEVRHSLFRGLNHSGIVLRGNHTAIIEDNQFTTYSTAAVFILSSLGANSQVMCNEMSSAAGAGIYAFDMAGDGFFANNYIHDLTGNQAYGIRSRKVAGDLTVQNNLIVRVGDGIQETMNGTNLPATLIQNNVIFDCDRGMVFTGAGGSIVRMNAVLNCPTGLLMYSPNFGLPASITYNAFFNNGADFEGIPIAGLGSVVTTNTQGDSSDVWSNLFLDPIISAPNTWYPAQISPLIDAGDPAASLDSNNTLADIGLRADEVNCFSIPELSTRAGTPTAVAPPANSAPLKLVPQPAHDQFRVDLAEEIQSITLYGLDGKSYSLPVNPDQVYPVERLPRGLYLVRVETALGLRSGRLLLQ